MNNKKNLVFIFLIGIMGYFLGAIVYDLVSGFSRAGSHLSGFLTATVFFGLYFLYLKKKFPKILDDMTIEQHDEREKTIREKAGHCTLYFVFASTFIISIFAMIKNHILLGIVSGSIYVILLTIYLLLTYYFKRKI